MLHHLQELVLKSIPEEHQWKIKLLSQWHDIMGNLNTQVSLEKIEHDMLVLGVTNSCWMQELYLLSPLLLTTINQKLDRPRIKRLRFKKIILKQKQPINIHENQKSESKKIQLTFKEQQALNGINDTLLREALYAFRIRCYQEK